MAYDGTLKFDTQIDDSGFQSGLDKLSGLASGAMKAVASAITAGASAIAGLGAASVNAGMSFEASMSNVAAISGATGSDLQRLTDKAMEMGAKTKFSASESADAFSYMAMAGWKTEDMVSGIEGIMNLAAASGEDLASTSDIVTDALTAFGLTAADAGHFADIIAVASSNANTNVGMMGETFKYVAPVAGALGVSAEDAAEAIGLMANSGIKASQAGTSMRSILTRLATNAGASKTQIGALDVLVQRLGVDFYESDGTVRDFSDVLGEARVAWAKLGSQEQTEYAKLIAGQEAMSAWLALMNAAPGDIEKLEKSIAGCTDELTGYSAAAEMAAVMNDNLQGQLTILGSALEGLEIKIYRSVEKPLKDVIKTAQDMVQLLTDAFDENGFEGLVEAAGEALAQIAIMAADAAPALIDAALGLVDSFISSILDNGDRFAAAGAELAASVATAVIAGAGTMGVAGIELFRKLLEALAGHAEEIGSAAAQTVLQLAAAIARNAPLIIRAAKDIVHGFAQGLSEEFPGVGALLEGFFNGFADTLGKIAGGVVDVLRRVFETINGADPETLRNIGEAVGKIAAAFVALQAAKTAASALSGLFGVFNTGKTVIGNIAGVIPKVIEGFQLWRGGAGTLAEVIQLEFPKMFSAVSGAVKGVQAVIQGAVSLITSTVGGIALVAGGAVLAVTNFVSMFQNGFSVVQELLMGVGIAIAAVGAVILGAPAAVAAVVAGVVAAVATLVVLIKEHWNEISAWFGGVWKTVTGFFSGLPEKVGAFFGGIAAKAGEFFNAASNAVTTFFSELPGKISAFFSNVITSAADFFSNLRESVSAFLSELPYKVGYALGQLIGSVIKWGQDVVAWATETLPQIVSGIAGFFMELPGKVAAWFTETLTRIQTWGSDTLNAAKQAAGNVIDAVVAFFSGLPEKVGKCLSDTLSRVVQWGSETLKAAGDAAKNAVDSVVSFFTELPGKVWKWLCDTVSKVAEFGGNLLESGKKAAGDCLNGIVDAFTGLPDKMLEIGGNVISGLVDGITGEAKQLWDTVTGFCSGIVDGVKDALGIHSPSTVMEAQGAYAVEGFARGLATMPSVITDTLSVISRMARDWGSEIGGVLSSVTDNAVSMATKAFSALPGGVRTQFSNVANAAVSFGTDLANKGKNAAVSFHNALISTLNRLPDQMRVIGKNIVTGVWNGISSMADSFRKSVGNFFGNIVNNVKNTLGIHSPSAVFAEEVGEWIPPGVGDGIADAMPALLSSTRKQMRQLADSMKTAVELETGKISFQKTGPQAYEQAREERALQREIAVTGQLESEQATETHVHVHVGTKEVAEEIAPAVNRALYRINNRENNRGRGN